MGVNHNRNSIHVLRTTGVGWLAHQNIPNLSIGTDQAFTIQVYVLTANDTDGILYAQEGGFRLRLSNGIPVFQLGGFGTISAGADWMLGNQSCYYIAVRYSEGKLSMFLGGLPVAEADATPTQACSGAFVMGKGFAGGLPMIRVSARALTDQEILQHNAQTPAVDSSCVFQSDCQTLQYKDVSANRLPIWACGEGAGCGMYTACTTFIGRGQCACTPRAELGGDHAVLLKLWPYSSEARQCVYTAMNGSDTVYSVELVPQEDASFSLCLSNGTTQVVSERKLLPTLWQDIALVFSQAKVQLYLDGAADVQADFPLRAARTALLIGAEYGAGPVYEKGYQGHLAYSAEFSRALTAQEVAVYADDPPYLFAKDLATLLPFDWADETELVSMVPISKTGYAQFSLVADTTPIDTPIGVSVLLPDEESPEWAQMSKEDQWCLNQVAALAQAIYPIMLGYLPAETDGKPPVQRCAPKVVQGCFSDAVSESRQVSPCPTGREAWDCVRGMTVTNRPFGVPGVFRRSCCETFFSLCAPFTCLQSHWGAVMGIAAVAVLVTAVVYAVVNDGQADRPQPEDSPLKVTGICWNHLGEPACGSLHYHCGGPNLPTSMVDEPDGNTLLTRCVLVPSELRFPTVDVTLSYADTAPAPFRAVLTAIDLEDSKLLGDTSQAFTIAPGESVTVTLSYDASKLPTGAIGRVVNRWQFRAENTFLINCNCTIYTLRALPVAPWVLGNGTAYNPAGDGYIWTEMLDFFLPEANAPDEFAKHAVERLNGSGFVYDTQYGACWYCDNQYASFKLRKFVEHAKSPAGHELNCSDCAYIVSAACAMVGIDLPMAIMSTCYSSQGFLCNKIIAIGSNEWKVPFDKGGGEGGFSYHQFNISGMALSENTPIYDACLKVDGGDSPGDGIAGAQKVKLLPQSLPASETNNLYVNVPPDQPYQTQVYRERLVKDGQPCWFVNAFYRVQYLDVTSVNATKRAAPVEDPRIQELLTHFALTPSGAAVRQLQYKEEIHWPASDDGQIERIEEEADYQMLRFLWRGERCRVEHWLCRTEVATANRLAATLAYIAHPDIRAGEDEQLAVGERCFLVGDGGVIFMRAGHVFAVYADTLNCARSLAQALDQSAGG